MTSLQFIDMLTLFTNEHKNSINIEIIFKLQCLENQNINKHLKTKYQRNLNPKLLK